MIGEVPNQRGSIQSTDQRGRVYPNRRPRPERDRVHVGPCGWQQEPRERSPEIARTQLARSPGRFEVHASLNDESLGCAVGSDHVDVGRREALRRLQDRAGGWSRGSGSRSDVRSTWIADVPQEGPRRRVAIRRFVPSTATVMICRDDAVEKDARQLHGAASVSDAGSRVDAAPTTEAGPGAAFHARPKWWPWDDARTSECTPGGSGAEPSVDTSAGHWSAREGPSDRRGGPRDAQAIGRRRLDGRERA